MSETTPPQRTPAEAYNENMRLMQQVVAQMKEIPVLPSEQPKDVHALTRVEFPEVGGVLTYMEGYAHPYRGFPFFEFVDKIDVIKKISRAILSGMYHELKGNKLKLLTLIPCLWISKVILSVCVYVFYRMVERFRIKSIVYSQPMRELYRAFSAERQETEKMRTFRTQLRDLVCMVLEFDNAYRYRLQDVIVELDQPALRKNPVKELTRLLDIVQSREKKQDVSDTWKLLKLFVAVYVRYDKEFRRMLVDVLSMLNLKEMELNDSDKQFSRPRTDYTFGFMLKEQKETGAITVAPKITTPYVSN